MDDTGNIYIAGLTLSTDSIATPGAYQTTNGGAEDAFLAKFSKTGLLRWATYFGGPRNDNGTAVACDHSGNVFIAGITGSATHIASAGAHQPVYGGGLTDGFLAKFTGSGAFRWATYFWGDTTDAILGVTCADTSVYITGGTMSTTNIATAGAYKTTHAGSFDDAFLAKFGSSGGILWSTYYGGSNEDFGFGIDYLPGKVIVGGLTHSIDSIATTGVHQAHLVGAGDAFLAVFTDSGALSWATYYGGSGTYGTNIYSISHDTALHIFVTGNTGATDSIATPGAYRQYFMGGVDAFVADFSSSGELLWGSYFGGTANDVAYGIACDPLCNVYITGRTISTDSIATPGAYQVVYGGNIGDAFLAKFRPPPGVGVLATTRTPPNVEVYPNPASGILYLQYDGFTNAIFTLTNMAGQVVVRSQILQGSGKMSFELTRVLSGNYEYAISEGDRIIKNGRIVKN